MKKERKVFLLVWIPLFIILSLAIFASTGRSGTETIIENYEARLIYYRDITQSFETSLTGFMILLGISIYLYIMVGLEEVEPYSYKSHKRKG